MPPPTLLASTSRVPAVERVRSLVAVASVVLAAGIVVAVPGCGAPPSDPSDAQRANGSAPLSTSTAGGEPTDGGAAASLPGLADAGHLDASAAGSGEVNKPSPCPSDMAFVDTVHCPETQEYRVKLKCLDHEYNAPNHLTICNKFAPGQECRQPLRRQRFCIDRYEYPNVEGGHPPVMISAFDAAALCSAAGKRLCWESEWTAACEGPERLPFPYGRERSAKQCNIDNPYVHPSLEKLYHSNQTIQDAQLRKLDQSKPSGAMAGCKSGFGVHDLTGNFDEWVLTEQERGKGGWAGLKGGAWGHVRNACRPITTSHAPEFIYYFISTRCCKDPDRAALSRLPPPPATPAAWSPPPAPTPKPFGGRTSQGWTP